MKTQILKLAFLAAVSFTAMSCDDDKMVGETDLPQASRDFLATHFAGVNVTRIEKERDSYSVYLSNRIEIDFNNSGEWTEVDGEDGVAIPTGYILPQIVAYVEDNYSGNPINGIEKVRAGFDVDLVRQDIDLVFGPDGGFVRVDP
ncbi:PepSY-like domain-containing protein [Sphingobacterium paludis]|uniref:Putative PepSY-like beta-lactamase-inhibitor n=1 Tax=Sphingobacterium paludis TaxID=1476465 RepID=A0A4V6PZX7_9SPHI|nr:PepSY-like domain-containing protein [Sphingobacterium paludis]TDS12438.1 putative PepSY-like beta-lactamase-inhibitor [Sphingobacterium paludis]